MKTQPKEVIMSDKLKEIIDYLYMLNDEYCTVRIGIWDADETPYTFYATLHNEHGNVIIGESSYGSETLEEAIDCLYAEFVEWHGSA